MIQIEHTETYGWEAAIRGMRNPLNSWGKSDSFFGEGLETFWSIEKNVVNVVDVNEWNGNIDYSVSLGKNDLTLMKSLIKAGTDHSKFMRMITVTCDITAPLYWIKELDTYKVGTVRNSCSTMHTIHKKKFELDDFSHEYMYTDADGVPDHDVQITENVLGDIVRNLNYCRAYYLETGDKRAWYNMIQLLPSSYNQRFTWQANYAVLRNIYHARKNHRLTEWYDFCKWIESLPYSELITEWKWT